ncbi:MAG: exosortase C-terminal domain/associated protein EpsI [Terrimicrobiaceae bacterium]
MSLETKPPAPTGSPQGEHVAPPKISGVFFIKLAAVAAVIGATLWFCTNASELNTVAEPGVQMSLPRQIGNFYGTEEEASEAERKILPGDTEILRMRYENIKGDSITASIVLSGGEKRSIHRPEICLPAQGWTIGTGHVIPITLASGKTMDVMQLKLSRPVEIQPGVFHQIRSQFIYWFVGKDITTADHKVRIFKTSWDRVFHKTNHRWAYVLISALVEDSIRPGGRSSEETTKMLEDFIREIVPAFQKSEMKVAAAN